MTSTDEPTTDCTHRDGEWQWGVRWDYPKAKGTDWDGWTEENVREYFAVVKPASAMIVRRWVGPIEVVATTEPTTVQAARTSDAATEDREGPLTWSLAAEMVREDAVAAEERRTALAEREGDTYEDREGQ